MFNYTHHLEKLIRHICATMPEFSHVDCDRLLIGYAPARLTGEQGLYAKIVPMKFEGGVDTTTRGRYTYRMPELYHKEHQILYVIYFCMPKFADLKFDTKLGTVLHELFHISPLFNGDIRRFPGPKYAHGYSLKKYQQRIFWLRERYLAACNGTKPYEFLELSLAELEERHGGVVASRIKQPRPILVQP